nr:serine/arginine repetitive matrix 4 [Myotis myotis]
MASVQQGEKQLFEKFWRGTFKAVATPRPESIIVASITARKPLPRTEPQSSPMVPGQDGPSAKLSQHLATEASGTSWERDKACRERSPARARSASRNKDRTPPPSSRGKKKKKKSARKRRRRSPSYSPSPVKKKKKKNSKKHKRCRSFSKKRRHSSSSPKSKRREEKRHKKQ